MLRFFLSFLLDVSVKMFLAFVAQNFRMVLFLVSYQIKIVHIFENALLLSSFIYGL